MMSDINQLDVYLWGTKIGVIGWAKADSPTIYFEYTDEMMSIPIEISPIKMKRQQKLHAFTDISERTFKGLPGIFADSLPDKFGSSLIDQYMAQKNIPVEDITALDRLAYIGDRAMGALEYVPMVNLDGNDPKNVLDLNSLEQLADMVLNNKSELAKNLQSNQDHEQAIKFIRVGSSAGGARAKALVAISHDKSESLFDGTVDQGEGFSYYLIKFDSESNSDRDAKDPKGMTEIEYNYFQIANKCGITTPATKIINTQGSDKKVHFLIERFDRYWDSNKKRLEKLHYASWCALAHAHRDTTGTYSYEQLVLLVKQMNLGQSAVTQIFKRAVFNIIGRNQDDHTKNFGFLMDKQGNWSLSPAFDLTYAYDPLGQWTSKHQINLNAKQDDFTRDDLIEFGYYCNLKDKQINNIIDKTIDVFKNHKYSNYSASTELIKLIKDNQRLGL
ncbi:MAG: type II toxin-antitoxin system HipA family toxin [Pseudomonadales bacterium]|nr:type II toxin-antitoxin system HipA family toxin [Pseudomonadales bacterium]